MKNMTGFMAGPYCSTTVEKQRKIGKNIMYE
jgi:hypothetical protein